MERSVLWLKVIIIGAGPAGLTAAYELLRHSSEAEVILIEQDDYVGGISKTVQYKDNRMDIGGHRYFSNNTYINQWWKSVCDREDIIIEKKRKSQILYKRKLFSYPVKLSLSTLRNLGIANSVSVVFSFFKAQLNFKIDPSKSLETFYIKSFGKKLYSLFFEDYTFKVWGKHPSQINSTWGSQRVKGLSILTILNGIAKNKDDAKFFKYPQCGSGQLWECVADKIEDMGGTIIKNAKVNKIISNSKNVIERIQYEQNGQQMEIDDNFELISSMPLKDLVNGMSGVPNNLKAIANNLPYRDFIIAGVLIDRNKINGKYAERLLSNHWIYVQDKTVKVGRIQIFNNWSAELVKDEQNTIWIGLEYFATEGDMLWSIDESQFINLCIDELLALNIVNSRDAVLDAHIKKQEKAYPAYWGSYNDLSVLSEYLSKIKNLYCIGRNGQHKYNNIDHSMLSAFAAVNCIVNCIDDKSAIWNVNTDKEYNE